MLQSCKIDLVIRMILCKMYKARSQVWACGGLGWALKAYVGTLKPRSRLWSLYLPYRASVRPMDLKQFCTRAFVNLICFTKPFKTWIQSKVCQSQGKYTYGSSIE